MFFKKDEINWIVTFSVPYETNSDKTRAEIILTITEVEENKK